MYTKKTALRVAVDHRTAESRRGMRSLKLSQRSVRPVDPTSEENADAVEWMIKEDRQVTLCYIVNILVVNLVTLQCIELEMNSLICQMCIAYQLQLNCE